ncbi:DUF4097 family beta strand repeat-containing protein [Streptomyces longispororuber]|uniref:DUF4097 family beta strand repeat-containing protein n=1 Tax=Streptomyces longispororuber TaxID=68230 RepID=UPI00210E5A5F|nr:DUF4097 family beta strand repeat-containing protein [Streptomyces longispororuber]MCQ4212389.1 DUF4097 domain-containing protein [Streptomyces longispororuber]
MQKFDTPAPVSAVLDIPAGRIQLIAADRTDTTVEILPANPAKGRDVKAAEQVEVAYADGVLHVRAPQPKNQLLGSTGSVEVTVQLPTGSRVEAKAAAAEFRGVGRLGDVAVDGGHGLVKLDETDSAHLTGHDADITIGRLNGPGEITTQRGNLNITEATRGTLKLTTQMGNITVGAAHGISATLDAGTSHGRIHNSLKNSDDTPGLTIHATTSQGDIAARSL